MVIINGKTGKPIYKPAIDNAGLQTNGLTISLEGYGNDLFLYWINECKNFEDNLEMFEFVPGKKNNLVGDVTLLNFSQGAISISKFDRICVNSGLILPSVQNCTL